MLALRNKGNNLLGPIGADKSNRHLPYPRIGVGLLLPFGNGLGTVTLPTVGANRPPRNYANICTSRLEGVGIVLLSWGREGSSWAIEVKCVLLPRPKLGTIPKTLPSSVRKFLTAFFGRCLQTSANALGAYALLASP